MSFTHGWLENCHAMISNHYHLPPSFDWSDELKLVVIHCISLPVGNYDKDNERVERLFMHDMSAHDAPILKNIMKQSGRVSAHFYIKRSGERIQFVPVNYCAWHAGVSTYQQEKNCNNFSLGIELQGQVGESFTSYQYDSLCSIVLALQKKFLRLKEIDSCLVGHSDIAPGRKKDPGEGFDWQYFMMKIKQNQ